MRIVIALAAAVMLLGTTFASADPPGPPDRGPVDVLVTNPSVPVTVVPSWTPATELVTYKNKGAFDVGFGGKLRTTEFAEDSILTAAYLHVDSPLTATPDGNNARCAFSLQLVENCVLQDCDEVALLGEVGTTSQKSASQLIDLPNVYVAAGVALQATLEINTTGDYCWAFINVRGVKATQN